MQAAVEAKRTLPFEFTLTARAENFLFDRPDLDDTIRRLQAFEKADADVLFAPGLTIEEVAGQGSFSFSDHAVPFGELNNRF